MLKRIAITGPESTGKSSLAQQLAIHYHDVWVPEYAREYIDHLKRPYQQEDILGIAKKQIELEEIAARKASQFLFCDTELIVCKIWSEHKYHHCDPWISEMIKKSNYHLYLLCDIDLPWEADPQREHPNLRQHFFLKYQQELTKNKFNFKIVSGQGQDRLNNAIKLISQSL